MPRQSKKNISNIVADIKYPGLEEKVRGNYLLSLVSKSDPRFNASKKSSGFKKLLLVPTILMVIIAAYLLNIFDFKNRISQSAEIIYQEVMKLKSSTSELKGTETVQSLKNIDNQIKNIQNQTEESAFVQISNLMGQIMPALKQIPSVVKNASAISGKILETAEIVDYLTNNAIQLLTTNKGNELIETLESLKNNIAEIKNLNTDIKNQSLEVQNLDQKLTSFSDILSDNYISIDSKLFQIQDLLESLLVILKSDNQHILILFQNPSEMRPAGGFIGSFGDITISQGNIKKINVDDIYNSDRQLEVKAIPPKELQGITRSWGARDANWFFNFATSAQKVKEFLEQSKLFSENNVQFQGVIAVNSDILETILKIIGPIDLPEYDLTIDENNYLSQIQYEVEAGRDKKPGENPKKILSIIAPVIIDKLKNLNDPQKQEFFSQLEKHLAQKDIMIYAPDQKLQKALLELGMAGEIFSLPENFKGDYLAVVNANIASGKTDIFINQKIKLESNLLNSGKITNKLTLTRTHTGQNEKDWWYKTTNKNYVKIFMPSGSKIIEIKGNNPAPENKTSFDYGKNKYVYDANLKLIEDSEKFIKNLNIWTGQESDKKFFGTWFNTPAGESKTMEVFYERDSAANIEDGKKYEFVFDKQSGVISSLTFTINAPLGYIWQESGTPNFEFKAQELNTREMIDLTLKKI